MTVSLEIPRAASLPLVAGELALDFANTCSGRDTPAFRDHLTAPEHVALWAGDAGLLAPAEVACLVAAPLKSRLLAAARALREDVHALGVALATGRDAPPDALKRLTRAHLSALSHARLAPQDGRYRWSWPARERPVEAIIGPISMSALKILQSADPGRVRQCRGDSCGWLFYDVSKNNSRRWCEMEVCGNRAKQRRFAQRARA